MMSCSKSADARPAWNIASQWFYALDNAIQTGGMHFVYLMMVDFNQFIRKLDVETMGKDELVCLIKLLECIANWWHDRRGNRLMNDSDSQKRLDAFGVFCDLRAYVLRLYLEKAGLYLAPAAPDASDADDVVVDVDDAVVSALIKQCFDTAKVAEIAPLNVIGANVDGVGAAKAAKAAEAAAEAAAISIQVANLICKHTDRRLEDAKTCCSNAERLLAAAEAAAKAAAKAAADDAADTAAKVVAKAADDAAAAKAAAELDDDVDASLEPSAAEAAAKAAKADEPWQFVD